MTGHPLKPEIKAMLEKVSVATLATALYKRGLRNQVIQDVRPVSRKGRNMVGPGPEPQRLSDIMSSAWIAFARSGDPNIDGLPQWPPYDLKHRATMIFDSESRVQNDPYSEIRLILLDSDK